MRLVTVRAADRTGALTSREHDRSQLRLVRFDASSQSQRLAQVRLRMFAVSVDIAEVLAPRGSAFHSQAEMRLQGLVAEVMADIWS